MINFKELIKKSKDYGFENISIVERTNKALSIQVFEGKVDKNEIAENSKIIVRGLINDKMATLSLENYDMDMDDVLNTLKQNALAIESDEKEEIFAGSKEYPVVKISDFDFDSVSTNDKIKLLLDLEAKCKALDSRITTVSDCWYEESNSSYHIINSKGLDIIKYGKYCLAGAGVVAVENGDTQNAYHYLAKERFEDLNIDEIAGKAVKDAIDMFNAKPVKTDRYKVIMERDAMSSLLGAFSGMFSGDQAIKKVTPFLGKENQKIFSDKITIIDNPLLEGAINKDPFDDEGVACYEKEIVKDGVLKTMLHSLKTAKYFNTESTGNGFASGRGITAMGDNFYIQNGTMSKEEMIKSLDKGLLITGLDGLHAGLDAISGDFSLKASGFYIEGGKISRPVTLIVVSGNFVQMMNDVISVGNDLEVTTRSVFAPSILFNDLPVSGN